MLSVHFVEGSGGDVLVTFSGAVDVADWTPSWFQLEDTGNWIVAESVDQYDANVLLFNSPDFPSGTGIPWRLLGHPVGLAAPYSGVTV